MATRAVGYLVEEHSGPLTEAPSGKIENVPDLELQGTETDHPRVLTVARPGADSHRPDLRSSCSVTILARGGWK